MRRIGRRLKEVFGKKVAFGLEGGYNLQARKWARATRRVSACWSSDFWLSTPLH